MKTFLYFGQQLNLDRKLVSVPDVDFFFVLLWPGLPKQPPPMQIPVYEPDRTAIFLVLFSSKLFDRWRKGMIYYSFQKRVHGKTNNTAKQIHNYKNYSTYILCTDTG